MDYANPNITKRAEESPLWSELSLQDGKVLPYLLERYLLLENWKRDGAHEAYDNACMSLSPAAREEINFLHLLLADATTALLGQEERIRKLEATVEHMIAAGQRLRGTISP